MRKVTIALIILMLSACSTYSSSPDKQLGRFRFNYRIENGPATGLIQAFDDGQRTYLQFFCHRDILTNISVTTGEDRPLEFEKAGCYARISGTYQTINITLNKQIKALPSSTIGNTSVATSTDNK